MLAHKHPLHDVDTQSDKSEDESENVDTTCNSRNKDLHISMPCMRMDRFYPNCTRCHCTICDFRLSEGNVTHVIASCSRCYCDEIMDVSTDKRHFFEHKIDE